MILVAIQPVYLPWVGYLEQMKRADLFIIEDTLQYTKQDWRNRNQIRTAQGSAWLTVPVKKCATDTPIRQVMIDNSQPWARKHLNMLRQNYGKAPYWKDYEPFIEQTYREQRWDRLLDLDLHFINFLARQFGIDTERRLLSETGVVFGPDKTQSLIDLTQSVGADTFLEGASGQDFIKTERFAEAGLQVVFQNYTCRPYPQQYEPFVSHMSALDLLLNMGPEGTALL